MTDKPKIIIKLPEDTPFLKLVQEVTSRKSPKDKES